MCNPNCPFSGHAKHCSYTSELQQFTNINKSDPSACNRASSGYLYRPLSGQLNCQFFCVLSKLPFSGNLEQCSYFNISEPQIQAVPQVDAQNGPSQAYHTSLASFTSPISPSQGNLNTIRTLGPHRQLATCFRSSSDY